MHTKYNTINHILNFSILKMNDMYRCLPCDVEVKISNKNKHENTGYHKRFKNFSSVLKTRANANQKLFLNVSAMKLRKEKKD